MALQFVLGNSGAGKTEYLYEQVLRLAAENPTKKYFMIVPEQFTMATQRGLVLRQENHAILNIDVLSFQRLAYRVFEELGEDQLQILEDTGKNLILQKLVSDLDGQFEVLSGSLHKPGMIDEIKSFLTELTQYRIQAEDLQEMAQAPGVSPLLAMKLRDLCMVYEAYRKRVDEQFLLAEEVVEHMAGLVSHSRLFDNATLIFDGFTGFTPIQMDFLREVFPVVDDIRVALTMDTREDFYRMDGVENLFYLSKKTIHGLLQLAKETHVDVQEAVILGDGNRKRFAGSPVLYHLEQNLFRLGKAAYHSGSDEDRQKLQIYHFTKPAEELKFAAREIRRLVREGGYRYRDIAIVTGDVAGFSYLIDAVFSDYEIPYFLDQTNQLLFHPLMELVGGLLELSESNFSYESMMRILKAGAGKLDPDVVDLMENYLLAYGIYGNLWQETWERLPDWMSAAQLEQLNAARQKLWDCLGPFYSGMKNDATVTERTILLYETLRALCADTDTDPKVWKLLMELLDKLVAILGAERLSAQDYKKILEAGFEAARIAYIPNGYDQVIVGDIERTRLEDVKILFFIGVNDGVIPANQTDGGIISQLEREVLADHEYELAPTAKERAFIQRFYLYMNLTKPSDRLYITYSKVGIDGTAMRPSYLVGLLLRLFPEWKVCEDERSPFENLFTPAGAISYFVDGLQKAKTGDADPDWLALFAWYVKDETWRSKLEPLLQAAFYRHTDEVLSEDVTHRLYGTVLENSVSRLERFAACAYAHFLTYGLGLSRREEHDFAANDFGNLVHTALESFAKGLSESAYNWFDVSEEYSDQLCAQAMEAAIAQTRNDALFSTAKNRYLLTRMRRLLSQTVDTLKHQVRKGIFIPADYELGFGFANSLRVQEFALGDEEKMRLRGRIDRVDLMEKDGKTYVKIIDYKSGMTQFSLLSMYHGLQLQLVVYLNAAMELMKKKHPDTTIEPAGIFYYHVDSPVIETTGEVSEEEIWQSVFEKLRLDGIVNDDPEIISAMDQQFTDKSDVIPVSRKSNGELSKTSKAYTGEQFHQISDFVNETIQNLGKRMIQGEIGAKPYEMGDRSACDYCDFQSVCGFDTRLPGCEKRVLPSKMSEDEIFHQIETLLNRDKLDEEEP